ncbi:MAG: hypothetical protein K2X39_06925 [Silvanigrellaceae bacterium]|nr:hypothetical protein [Silvanigrellaceae bacterium]
MIKKVLFYTRIENDTGGDQTFLLTLAQPIIEGLNLISSEEKIEISLVLSYDGKSKDRALRIKEEWQDITSSSSLKRRVWLNLRKKFGNASLKTGTTLLVSNYLSSQF